MIPEMETVYTLHVDIESVLPEVIKEHERRMDYFVLATNHRDASELPAEQVLREYKQQSNVELRFKFLKDPMFVDSLFLKTPERIRNTRLCALDRTVYLYDVRRKHSNSGSSSRTFASNR